MLHRWTTRLVLAIAVLFATGSCGVFSTGKLGAAACPAVRAEANALEANFSSNATANAKVRAFVQASKDIAWVSGRVEAIAADACRRMGADLGLPPGAMKPRKGPGGAAVGACEPVSARIDAILRQGVRLWVTIQPARCQANASAAARCAAVCDTQRDAECRASCTAHANVHASCEPARINVRVSHGAEMAGPLVATLQANLPKLIEAQLTLGQRLVQDARVVAQIGARMPKILGNAGAQALGCVAASADMAARASVRVRVSVRASARVTDRVRG